MQKKIPRSAKVHLFQIFDSLYVFTNCFFVEPILKLEWFSNIKCMKLVFQQTIVKSIDFPNCSFAFLPH